MWRQPAKGLSKNNFRGRAPTVREGSLAKAMPAPLRSGQIGLGVSVVIFGVPLWLALLHQATAVVMFAAAVHLNHRLATAP